MSYLGQEGSRSAVEKGEGSATEQPPGNRGEQKSAADGDNVDGGAGADPSSGNAGEQTSAAGEDHSRGIASPGDVATGEAVFGDGVTDTDKPSENEGLPRGAAATEASTGVGGHPVVTDVPPVHAVVGPAAVVAAQGSSPNTRRPSSTIAWLLVLQVQFLAVLSLVDSVGSDSSWLSRTLRDMR